jgi:DNA-binding XRE family transcriptional regulator
MHLMPAQASVPRLRVGLVSTRAFKERPAPRAYRPADVKRVRELVGVSQAVLAGFLGVNVNTVRSWEQGKRSASRLLAASSPRSRPTSCTGGSGSGIKPSRSNRGNGPRADNDSRLGQPPDRRARNAFPMVASGPEYNPRQTTRHIPVAAVLSLARMDAFHLGSLGSVWHAAFDGLKRQQDQADPRLVAPRPRLESGSFWQLSRVYSCHCAHQFGPRPQAHRRSRGKKGIGTPVARVWVRKMA